MDPQTIKLLLALILGIALGLAGAVVTMQMLARKGVHLARGKAQEVLAGAALQAESIKKEADLQSKEEAIRRREALDREVEDVRKSFRDQERRLENRGDLLDQRLDLITKKERDFESVQRYLAEQQEEVNRRAAELKGLLADQRETLHRIANLGPDEARAALFAGLEDELKHEVGGLILKHDQYAQGHRRGQKSRARSSPPTIQRYAASHTAETTTSARSTSPRTT